MQIKLLALIAGPEGVFHPGQIIDVSAENARALIDGRYAELVGGGVETAQAPAATSIETTELRKQRGRPKKDV